MAETCGFKSPSINFHFGQHMVNTLEYITRKFIGFHCFYFALFNNGNLLTLFLKHIYLLVLSHTLGYACTGLRIRRSQVRILLGAPTITRT